MEFVSSFPGFKVNTKPSLDKIEQLFFTGFPNEWTEDGSITIYLDGGAYTSLIIVVNPSCGIWLRHSVNDADGEEKNFFSLGDANKLDNYVDAVEDALTLEGLFVEPNEAWLAVKDFVAGNGVMSEQISWIAEKDIPEDKCWLVAVDCL